MMVMNILPYFLNLLSTYGQSLKYCLEIRALLHRNNFQMVFFIDPDQEGLGIVVEDASASWEISVQTSCFLESITWLQQEVFVGEYVKLLFIQITDFVVMTFEVSSEFFQVFGNRLFYFISLVFAKPRTKRISRKVTNSSHPGRENHAGVTFF